MKTFPRHIYRRPHGYEVLIKRRDLKWRAVVPYNHPDALARALQLRDHFYTVCGPVTRSHARSNTASVRQVVYAPVREHSEKPPEVRDRIVELMGDVPRIELFARQRAEGWSAWGNELPSDVEL